MRTVRFRRAYAVEVDGEIVGFVRGPRRWDAYLVDGGLIAAGLPSRQAAGERIAEAVTSSRPDTGKEG